MDIFYKLKKRQLNAALRKKILSHASSIPFKSANLLVLIYMYEIFMLLLDFRFIQYTFISKGIEQTFTNICVCKYSSDKTSQSAF